LALLKDVLIVDDHYDIVNVLQIKLQKEGFRVHGFTNPISALDYFKTDPNKIALIITDIKMPDMNGIELLLKIREMCSDVKAFIVTAVNIETVKPEIKRHGLEVEEIFQKPFSLDNFTKSVKKYTHTNNVK
jgi:DNA-binding NtrC family response regulator